MSGHGEGGQYCGGTDVTTGANGTTSFHLALPELVPGSFGSRLRLPIPSAIPRNSPPASKLCPSLPADFDLDGDVDDENYVTFFDCVTGPMNGPLTKGCDLADLDDDVDVDLEDFRLFLCSLPLSSAFGAASAVSAMRPVRVRLPPRLSTCFRSMDTAAR